MSAMAAHYTNCTNSNDIVSITSCIYQLVHGQCGLLYFEVQRLETNFDVV